MKISRRCAVKKITASVGAATIAGAIDAEARAEPVTAADSAVTVDQTLWYDRPAAAWLEALPVGNGRLGAMVYGGVPQERLQLNEGTLWAGGPHDYSNPEALAALPEIRKRIFAGDYRGAQDLVNLHFMSRPLRQPPYQALGNLFLDQHPGGSVPTGYRRELDLDSARVRTSYLLDGVHYRREVFASAPDQLIVVSLTADRPGKIDLTASLQSAHAGAAQAASGARSSADNGRYEIIIEGRNGDGEGVPGALKFAAIVDARPESGRTTAGPDGKLRIEAADSVVLLLSMATSYISFRDVSGDAVARARKPLDAARRKSLKRLAEAHTADYQRFYRRVGIELGPGAAGADAATRLPTDRRVRAFAKGGDPGLAALHFQFGRYLLISCSREGGQAATLQGLWNDSLSPPWGSKYTININTEMNYWPAAGANLLECCQPLFDMLADIAVTGQTIAAKHYGASGWVCHHNTDLWRAAAPIDGAFWGMWPMGGAWLCKAFWDHYEFTRNRDTLRKAYPIMKGAAQFFLDSLVPEPAHGWLVTCPSVSPENAHHDGVSICAGPTMDIQILRDLFDAVSSAAAVLGIDRAFRERVLATRAKLPPMQVGRQGQLQEWLEDWDAGAPEQHHRHVSHLYGLFPSRQITPRDTPDLFAAARNSLETRGDAATGWSLAWKINLWARLLDGDHAHKLIVDLISPEHTAPNLFDLHPPFQIDGNFGAVSGIVEMLLQSHNGEMHLLPALPGAWRSGNVHGLRARGAFTVEIAWLDGELVSAGIYSHAGVQTRLRYRDKTISIDLKAGGSGRWDGHARELT
ncbi:MAG TPA: glycoside hydrolase family 95 protein [Chthonomonadaceae bacterium]|nr:glycoside hydrolase family 95 protein [Chthonomonadaceae bacterium]